MAIYVYNHPKLTAQLILDAIQQPDIPLNDVSITQGFTPQGQPFTQVDLGPHELNPAQYRRLMILLGDPRPLMNP